MNQCMVNKRGLALLPALVMLVLSSSCGNQKTLRNDLNSQADAFAKEKSQELKVSEGTYSGLVHMNDTNQDFDCTLDIKQITVLTRNTQSQDGSEMVEVPKLSGSIRFPALENAQASDTDSFSVLTTPMGGFLKVMFDAGDYNPRSQSVILPYSVPGYGQTEFGDFKGTLSSGQYVGTWFAKPFGVVGTFSLRRLNEVKHAI